MLRAVIHVEVPAWGVEKKSVCRGSERCVTGAEDAMVLFSIVTHSPNNLKCHGSPMATAVAGSGENSSDISGACTEVRSKPLLFEVPVCLYRDKFCGDQTKVHKRSEVGSRRFAHFFAVEKVCRPPVREPAGINRVCITHFAFSLFP